MGGDEINTVKFFTDRGEGRPPRLNELLYSVTLSDRTFSRLLLDYFPDSEHRIFIRDILNELSKSYSYKNSVMNGLCYFISVHINHVFNNLGYDCDVTDETMLNTENKLSGEDAIQFSKMYIQSLEFNTFEYRTVMGQRDSGVDRFLLDPFYQAELEATIEQYGFPVLDGLIILDHLAEILSNTIFMRSDRLKQCDSVYFNLVEIGSHVLVFDILGIS